MENYQKKLEKLQMILHLVTIDPEFEIQNNDLKFDDGTSIGYFWTTMRKFVRERKESPEQKDQNIINMITLINRIREDYKDEIIKEKLQILRNLAEENPAISFFTTDEKFPDDTKVSSFWRPFVYAMKESDEKYKRHQKQIDYLKQLSENRSILKLNQIILLLKKNPSWGIKEMKQNSLSNGSNIYNAFYYIKDVLNEEVAKCEEKGRKLRDIDRVIFQKIQMIEEQLIRNKFFVIDTEMDQLYKQYINGEKRSKSAYSKLCSRAYKLADKTELSEVELYFLQSLAEFDNMLFNDGVNLNKKKK